LDRGLKLAPNDPTLILQNGAVLLSLGQAEKSLTELQRTPATGKSRFYMGMAYRHLKNHAAARKAFADAWQLGYHDPYVLYSLVEEDRAIGDKPSGMQHFQLFLQTFPDSAWMHLLLGDAYFDQKADEDARREYQQAVNINPDLLDAHYRLGYLEFQAGENKEAATQFEKEVELNPTFADAHLFLGETLLRLGQKEGALTHFRETLVLDPHSEMVYHRFAAVLTEMNRLDEAARTLSQGEKTFPNDPTFPAELARVLTRLNRMDEAHQEAEHARILSAERLKKLDVTGNQ
jgi:tetratricopeptide (TPR) repeat protein